MVATRKLNVVSIVLSLIAIVAAGVPIYLEFFSPIRLEIAVLRDAFISNTPGGVPDVQMYFALTANGPRTKIIVVDSVSVTITNRETSMNHRLTPVSFQKFPLVVQGGNVTNVDTLVTIDDYIPTAIDRYDAWFDVLSELIPDKKDEITKMQQQVRATFLPSTRDESEIPAERDPWDNEKIATWLAEVAVEDLSKVLFFVAGNYEMEIEILDPFGKVLTRQTRTFSIGEILSKTLRHRFNVNARVGTSLVSAN